MIQLTAIAIKQSVSLETGAFQNIVTVRLPDGTVADLSMDEATSAKFLQIAQHSIDGVRMEVAQQPATPPSAPEAPAPTPRISWATAGVILPKYVKAFKSLGAPEEMSRDAINKLIKQIDEEFSDDDWTSVLGNRETNVSSEPVFTDEAPVNPKPTRSRTVPKDSLGYPIVGGFDVQNILGGTSGDEDGVGQL